MSDPFTDEEFAEYFGEPARADQDGPRRVPRWIKGLGLLVAVAMLSGTGLNLFDRIVNRAQINQPAEIRVEALRRVGESNWGWLVSDVVVEPIDQPRVGAFVSNNPPDGVIIVDLRPWNLDRLDELIDHEIGHLLDFAVWGSAAPSDRRGGLGSEQWAECAAVAAGTKSIDTSDAEDAYHCYQDEFATYQETVASFDLVCRRWGDLSCRP